jgi:hypothetical protein
MDKDNTFIASKHRTKVKDIKTLNEFLAAQKEESGKNAPDYAEIAKAKFYMADWIRTNIYVRLFEFQAKLKLSSLKTVPPDKIGKKGTLLQIKDSTMPYALMIIKLYEEYLKDKEKIITNDSEIYKREYEIISVYCWVIRTLYLKFDLYKAIEFTDAFMQCLLKNDFTISNDYRRKTKEMVLSIKELFVENERYRENAVYKYGFHGYSFPVQTRLNSVVKKLDAFLRELEKRGW